MLLVQYKSPKGYTVVEGKLHEVKSQLEQYDPIIFTIPESGGTVLFPLASDCHISFIRELTKEEYQGYKDAEKERRKQQEASRSFGNKKPNLKVPRRK